MTIACLRYLLTCSPLISDVLSGSTHDHIVKGFHDIFPYVHEFWLDHLLNYSKALHAHPGEEKRVKAVQDLLCMLSSSQNCFAAKVLDPSSGAAAIEDISLDVESDALRDFPPAVRRYIAYKKRMPEKQTSSANGMDSNSELAQTDLNWISGAYRNFQREFESLLSAATSLDYHQMSARYCHMTVNSDYVHKFKIRHGKSAFLCRWSGCIRASAGFQSTVEREKHETTHTQRFRCSDPSCDFAHNGFSFRQALRKHILKYHTRVEDLVLPAFPISKSRSEKTSEDSHTRTRTQGQVEVKTSQVYSLKRNSEHVERAVELAKTVLPEASFTERRRGKIKHLISKLDERISNEKTMRELLSHNYNTEASYQDFLRTLPQSSHFHSTKDQISSLSPRTDYFR